MILGFTRYGFTHDLRRYTVKPYRDGWAPLTPGHKCTVYGDDDTPL